MKTIKLLFFCSVIILFGATSCIDDFTISGNGIPATEGRITLDFNKVQSEGEFDVHITNGDEFEVVVNAESNILPYIETNVSRNKLRIYIRGLHNVKNRLPMEVYITTPYIEGITQSGSGVITTDYFITNDMKVAISGSGRIETAMDALNLDAVISGSGNLDLSGSSNFGDFLVSGSGKINANDLSLRNCEATISGSGNMWVNVDNYLKASISGSGSVFYYGNPSIEKHISGSGNVIPYN
ncbi:hypothetical protein GM418_06320 [Maribellus comscasis]|uniref:Putative auto-transporter adhesin head GIN domain-containing protein n=1 Tax=Maribellus comscasis TaxID=2681766 RepID=A0A6I6JT23_9BACT|nr:head GIN domain-containing protein [Maribellus comscasis]QGY43287.1 hypothetical protein GM418_06320 [Maribellus comscasis]